MDHLDAPHFFGLLALVLATAKLFGLAARRVGQPAVLGELVAGVVLGGSVLGLIDPRVEVFHLLAELGVVVLLFTIGLETDLKQLVSVGGASFAVATAGVVLPFGLGFAACRLMGLGTLPAIVAGAALTATSVGITARVFSELGYLDRPEGRIVLGAAVIDDVVGLVILTVVAGLAEGQSLTIGRVAGVAGLAFGFLAATLVVGRWLVPRLFRAAGRLDLPGLPIMLAMILALALAWLADRLGSAPIIGAFAAGLLLHGTEAAHEVEKGVTDLGYVFVPVFFVAVGAAVDVGVFNPLESSNRSTLVLGGLLLLAAVVGKVAAGYVPFWSPARKSVIGVGMVPRGEVGLIFAQMGLASKVFDAKLFGAVTFMVFATTFLAPPLLRHLLGGRGPGHDAAEPEGIDALVTGP